MYLFLVENFTLNINSPFSYFGFINKLSNLVSIFLEAFEHELFTKLQYQPKLNELCMNCLDIA